MNREHASDKVRFHEIEVYHQYFAEEINNIDQEYQFRLKYEEFRTNHLEKNQQEKLVQSILPNVKLCDLSSKVLAQITLVYIEELVENSKLLSVREGSTKIKPEHIKETVRVQELRNENKSQRQFQDLFD